MKRIAAINVLNLGDNLVFLPVVQGLKQLHPRSDVLVVTSETAVDLYDPNHFERAVIRKTNDRFTTFGSRPFDAFSFLRQLRSFKPEAVIIAHAQPNMAHLAAFLSRAKTRIGGTHARLKRFPLLTHPIQLNTQDNMALQNWTLFAKYCETLKIPVPSLLPPKPDLSHLFLPSPSNTDYIVIHPGASQTFQRWPLDRYFEVAKILAKKIKVYFATDSTSNHEKLIQSKIHPVSIHNLENLVNVLKGASLFIGNNSGPMHVAAALGITSLIISGPSAQIWDPFWRTGHTEVIEDTTLSCIRCEKALKLYGECINLEHPMACMMRWNVEEITAISFRILEKKIGTTGVASSL